ncbi:MAG: sensor histidine kinase [Acidobacteriota bacterium]
MTHPRTAAARLALAFAGAIALALCVLFASFYSFVKADLDSRTDRLLLDKSREFRELAEEGGTANLPGEFQREAQTMGTRLALYRLLAPDGSILSGSNGAAFPGLSVHPQALPRLVQGKPLLRTISIQGRRYQARECLVRLRSGLILQLVHYMGDDEDLLEDLRRSFGFTLVGVFLGAALLGWILSRRALAGVEEATRTAQAIAGGTLENRVPLLGRGEEIDRLATTFNAMLDRIQAMVAEMRQVSDDIAHDLKSPLTRLRGQAEMALTAKGGGEELEALAANTVEECDRLLAMVNTMLDLSEAEAGVPSGESQRVDLRDLVREAYELYLPAAEEKGLALILEARAPVEALGSVHRFRRILANLLDNAIKYTPPAGRVTIEAQMQGGWARVAVRDSGPGIESEELPKIFDRFYRSDQSRSTPGSGLGLSLARALARAMGGDLTAESMPGQGSVFTLLLPAASPF